MAWMWFCVDAGVAHGSGVYSRQEWVGGQGGVSGACGCDDSAHFTHRYLEGENRHPKKRGEKNSFFLTDVYESLSFCKLFFLVESLLPDLFPGNFRVSPLILTPRI